MFVIWHRKPNSTQADSSGVRIVSPYWIGWGPFSVFVFWNLMNIQMGFQQWQSISHGAEITVRPLSQQAQSKVVRTDDEGYARFSLDGDTEYSIEAKMQGFKKTHLKHIRLIKPNPTVPDCLRPA